MAAFLLICFMWCFLDSFCRCFFLANMVDEAFVIAIKPFGQVCEFHPFFRILVPLMLAISLFLSHMWWRPVSGVDMLVPHYFRMALWTCEIGIFHAWCMSLLLKPLFFCRLKEIYTGGYQGCQGGNQAKKSSTGNAHSVQLPPED
jgi:hypothetical protein